MGLGPPVCIPCNRIMDHDLKRINATEKGAWWCSECGQEAWNRGPDCLCVFELPEHLYQRLQKSIKVKGSQTPQEAAPTKGPQNPPKDQ